MIKEKPCKGQNKALGHGCGIMTKVENRIHGLGKMCGCYSDWLLNSENGKIKMAKSIIQVQKPRVEFERFEKDYNDSNDLKKAKTVTKVVVHSYIRKRDKGKPCISCGCDWNDTFEAGHHYKSETFETLKYNLDNINGQCFYCNNRLEGNFEYYALNLPKRIGLERYNELVRLASIDKHFEKVWNVENLKEIRNQVKLLKCN